MRIDAGPCVLRPWRVGDEDSLIRQANDRDVWLNLRDQFPHPYTRADADAWIRFAGSQAKPASLAIEVESQAVGGVSLRLHDDIERVAAEIGYWLGKTFWNRGIMTAAVRAMTHYAFEQLALTRVYAVPFAVNRASHRVLENAGYTREGVLRRSAIKDGVVIDQVLFAITDDSANAGGRRSRFTSGAVPMELPDALSAAREIVAERFGGATVAFLAGSVMRGEATETSDLDLVVVYERLDAAYRESFAHRGWPVEAFVHDPATLRYFFESDRVRGVPTLADMVANGVALPAESDSAATLRALAEEVIAAGPPRWTESQLAASRYTVTNLVDDLRSPRSRAEALATGTALYSAVAEHYLRSRGGWSATAKAIPRRLRSAAPAFADRFTDAFAQLFERGRSDAVIALAEDALRPHGGWLFAGYKATAPREWRLADHGDAKG